MNTFKLGGFFTVECFDKNGKLKWQDVSHNIVTDEGIIHILDTIFSLNGATPNSHYYIGITDASPTISSADTLSSHAGWSEITPYSETTRQEYNEERTGLVVSNTSAKATFSINASATLGGSFVASTDTGTSGLLLSVSAFANGDKSVSNGDTIVISYEFHGASS